MYYPGDKVAHPGHGGCVIREICDKEFQGETRRYYVLIPSADPHTTILNPVENAELIGLRHIITAPQADELIGSLSDSVCEWVKDHTQRRQRFERILKAGDLFEIAAMVRELSLQNVAATLSRSDKDHLLKARRKLASEIALSKEMPFDAAMELLHNAACASEM